MAFQPQAATLPGGATALPGTYYTADDVLTMEIDRVFLRHWLCAGRSEQVARSGSFLTLGLADERILVVRDDGGRLAGFDNVCRHRGSLLCTEPTGEVGRLVTCPLHGWSYGLDGRLVHAPLMDGVDGFDPAAFSLPPVATAEWEGFVFVHLGRDPEPFTSAWAGVQSHFTRWGLPDLSVVHQTDYLVEANWKLIVENYSECYHCPRIHPRFADRCRYRSGQNDRYAGPFLGGYMDLNPGYTTLSMSGAACAAPLTREPDDLGRVHFYALFPNLLLSLHSDYVVAYTLWPAAPGCTLVRCSWLFAVPPDGATGDTEPGTAPAARRSRPTTPSPSGTRPTARTSTPWVSSSRACAPGGTDRAPTRARRAWRPPSTSTCCRSSARPDRPAGSVAIERSRRR